MQLSTHPLHSLENAQQMTNMRGSPFLKHWHTVLTQEAVHQLHQDFRNLGALKKTMVLAILCLSYAV